MIRCVKKFDVVSREIDEMMGDINSKHPQKISFIVDGVLMEFVDVTIELHNGFLKIVDDDDVCVLRYRNISAHQIREFIKVDDDDVDDADVDEIWRELYNTPSTLPSSLLNRRIPYHSYKSIVISFIMEYNGLMDESDIFEDEWMRDNYESYMRYYHSSHPTYGELNDDLSVTLWELYYPSHILKDDLMGDGDEWDKNSYLWINDVISYYLIEDERDFLGEWDDE